MINLKEHFYHWRFLRSWRPYLVIIVLGFLLYSQILFFDLTYLDDNTLIIDNQDIISDIKNLPLIFSSDAFFSGTNFYYRPILNLSFMLDTVLAGDIYFVYFLVNILLHLATAIMVFLILQKINIRKSASFLLSLVFLMHPAISQAVAWLPGRNDSLLAIFAIPAIWFLILFNEKPKLRFLLLYTLFFFLALLTKETSVFLPVLAVAYFLTIGRRQAAGKSEKFLVLLMSFFAGVIWYLMRNLAFGSENISMVDALQSIGSNLLNAIVLMGKIMLPINLSVLPVPADSSLWWAAAAFSLTIIAFFKSREINWLRWFFGLSWLLIFLLPPFVISASAPYILEHRLYLPIVGFLIMASELSFIKKLDFTRKKVKIIVFGVLIVLALITFFHSHQFKNRLVFWESAVKDSPHSVLAQKNMGAMYYLDGRLKEAEKHYLEALRLEPSEPMVNNNLGLIYVGQGDEEMAEKFFLKELSLYPDYDKALFNLGFLYYKQGKISEAKYLLEACLRSNPRHSDAYRYLDLIYNQIK